MRSNLLWFGRPPNDDDKREAKNRRLSIHTNGGAGRPPFRYARGAVFWATSPYFDTAAQWLDDYLVPAVNEGLQVFVVVSTDAQRKEIERTIAREMPGEAVGDRVILRVAPVDSHEVPNSVLMHEPGPAANDGLEIVCPAGVVLLEAHRLLLQRAFADCKSIKMDLIPGGLSGALTCLVDATLIASNAGRSPKPYFAKLHTSEKLRAEMQSFKQYAEHHVDWYLRPNFLHERCIYGVEFGILVGSFVAASKSLWEVAAAGEGPALIRTLFTETLGVLREEPDPPAIVAEKSVMESLERFVELSEIPQVRVDAAKEHGGEVYSPNLLWRKLLNVQPDQWKHCAMHGDMHGENVRVRKEDAIVIDFAHATRGPMSGDLASLEVWLAFKVPPGALPHRGAWMHEVERLYSPGMIEQTLASEFSPIGDGWLHACITEIRRLAQKSICSTAEYMCVLAVYLLRHASFPAAAHSEVEDEFRRAYAYWLANRIVMSVCSNSDVRSEVA